MTLKIKKLKMVAAIITIGLSTVMMPEKAMAFGCSNCVNESTFQQYVQSFNQKLSDVVQAIKDFQKKFEELNKATDNPALTDPTVPAQSPTSGKSKPANIDKVIKDMTSKGKSIPDTLIEIAKAEQQIRLNEQADLSVYLDANIGTVPCKSSSSSSKCTILKYLQEQVANQVDTLQKDVVTAGAYWLLPNNKMGAPSLFNEQIYKIGFTDKVGKDANVVSSFLSPAPMVPAGFEPDYTKGALTPERAKVLGDALVGLSDFRDYMDAEELRVTPSGRIIQAKIMTRFSRMQLARHAIMQVNHKSVADAMNVEFKACVIRPTIEDTLNTPTNQHLVNIEQLLKCNNLSLMHVRRLQMEQSRLLAALLATMLDQWAFSTSAEAGNTLSYTQAK